MRRKKRGKASKRRTSSRKKEFRLTAAQKRTAKKITGALILFSLALIFAVAIFQGKKPGQEPEKPAPAPVKTSKPEKRPEKPKPKPAPKGPLIVFVIDDIGYHTRFENDLKALGPFVTYAILPSLPYSGHFSRLSETTGAEVILHLPLEAREGNIPGRGLITTRMPESQVLEVLGHNLDSVPHASGVNNHMGSLGTARPALMKIILGDLKKRGLFFLDSLTTSQSVASALRGRIGIPVLKRDIFLDNDDNPEAIRQNVAQLKAEARRKGFAIGIGHYRANTLSVLKEALPGLLSEGFNVTSLEEVIRRGLSA